MRILTLILLATAACVGRAERIVTALDGNDWTLDGLPVLVPNSWNKLDASDGWPKGLDLPYGDSSVSSPGYARRTGTYRRALPSPRADRRYFVRCEAASSKATVRVNGRAVGSHVGAFTAFCFEITDALRATGNVLEIEVSNIYDPTVPPASGDFSLCGGLYRSVSLIETPPVCIDPTTDGSNGVTLAIDTNGTVVATVRVNACGTISTETQTHVFADPELWTPEHPKLYSLHVEIASGDAIDIPFGFRTAELREDGFYLNGVRRKVRGVNRHQDVAGLGWEQTPAMEERDVRLMKAMGVDAVRLSHYPQSDSFLAACDRHGIMAWCEIPIVDRMDANLTAFTANAQTMLREMIAQCRHHPSVCWWGVFNELYNNCAKKGEGHDVPDEQVWTTPISNLVATARSLDPTRPVVSASNMLWRRALNAQASVCLNTYPGWYFEGSLRQKVDEFAKVNRLSTLAVSEYGAGASVWHHENPAVHHGPYSLIHNEEVQTKVHMDCYRDIAAHEKLWGSFAWLMFDCASDNRHEGDRAGVNDKGLVTQDRTTMKDAYFLYKANWNPEPMLYLTGKRMLSTTNAVVDVVAFSTVGDVALSVDGKPVATQAPDEIKSVLFKSVPLTRGAHEIRVTAKNLEDHCIWRRK